MQVRNGAVKRYLDRDTPKSLDQNAKHLIAVRVF
jgi:hypothetical protein